MKGPNSVILGQFLARARNPVWGRPGGPGSTPHGPWTCWASWATMLDEFRWSWGRATHPHVDVHAIVLTAQHCEASTRRAPPYAKSAILLENVSFPIGNSTSLWCIQWCKQITTVRCTAPAPSELVQHRPPRCPAGPGTVRSRSRASRAPPGRIREVGQKMT